MFTPRDGEYWILKCVRCTASTLSNYLNFRGTVAYHFPSTT